MSAAAVLDALEAATYFGPRPSAADADPNPSAGVRRAKEGTPFALLEIDGLEESAHADQWPAKLTELRVLLADRPRIRLVCSTRSTTLAYLTGPNDAAVPPSIRETAWAYRFLEPTRDLPLPELFARYAIEYKVNAAATPWLAWSLRTPLAIRLFMSLHAGQTLPSDATYTTGLPGLVRLLLERIEQELQPHADGGWPPVNKVVHAAALAVVRRYLERGTAISLDEATEAIRPTLPVGLEDARRVAHILDGLVAHAVLDRWTAPAPTDPLAPPSGVVYAPALNVMVDVVLGHELAQNVTVGPNLPPSYADRETAVEVAVAVLAGRGHYVVQQGTWAEALDSETLARMQCRALADLRGPFPIEVTAWVRQRLTGSMVTCRATLGDLIVPAARVPGHPFGAAFLDGVLRPQRVADRDLIWSGPERLPGPATAAWAGDAAWDADGLTLDSADAYDGLPLVAAWLCATVVLERRQALRQTLAEWGAVRPEEMAKLLDHVARTINDGQVVQEVTVAAAGAAMRTRPDAAGLADLADRADAMFFAENAPARTTHAVTRHAARLIVERAVVGVAVGDDALRRARPPYSTAQGPALLPLDADAAEGDDAASVLFMDLGWYVAPMATEGFFEPVRPPTPPVEEGDANLDAIVDDILEAMVAGKLAVPAEVVEAAQAEITARTEGRKTSFAGLPSKLLRTLGELFGPGQRTEQSQADANAAVECLQALGGTPDEAQDDPASAESIDNASQDESGPAETLRDAARALLSQYAAEIDLPTLRPETIGRGLIVSHVRRLGWDRKRFVGRLADEQLQPAERLVGADTAVFDVSGPTRGPTPSPVAPFREKYVRDAVNTIAGYLGDRLEYESRLNGVPPGLLTDQCVLGTGMPEPYPVPLTSVAIDKTANASTLPGLLAPAADLIGQTPAERARHWVAHGPWPDLALWPGLGRLLGDAEQIVLYARCGGSEPQSMGDTIAWVSAFAVADGDNVRFLERDLKIGRHWPTTLASTNGFYCGFRGGSHVSPSVAAWAPWVQAEDAIRLYHTVNDAGEPHTISLQALAANMIWEGQDQTEHIETMLAPLLRDTFAVGEGRLGPDGRDYFDGQGLRVAEYLRPVGSDGRFDSNEVLLAAAGSLRAAMSKLELRVGWIVRILREVPYGLATLKADGSAAGEYEFTPDARDRRDETYIILARSGHHELDLFGPFRERPREQHNNSDSINESTDGESTNSDASPPHKPA